MLRCFSGYFRVQKRYGCAVVGPAKGHRGDSGTGASKGQKELCLFGQE